MEREDDLQNNLNNTEPSAMDSPVKESDAAPAPEEMQPQNPGNSIEEKVDEINAKKRVL